MDTTRFDEVARLFGSGMTRHEALRGLVAGAAALTAGGELLQAEDASARKWRRRMNRKKTQNQGLPPGARWSSGQQCAANHICEVPVNGSNSDTYCSGVTGAPCGPPTEDGDATAPYCAVGHQCFYNTGSSAGVCQQLPDAL
jgi:hypothetical protein